MQPSVSPQLFAYDNWANQQVLTSVARTGTPPPQALRIMAHIAGAQCLWLARIHAEPQPCPVWPEWSMGEIADALEKLHARWSVLLAGDLGRSIDYTNTRGEQFQNRVSEILLHVLAHGAHHRGQIALLLRQAGFEPATTDYIVALRTGALTPD